VAVVEVPLAVVVVTEVIRVVLETMLELVDVADLEAEMVEDDFDELDVGEDVELDFVDVDTTLVVLDVVAVPGIHCE
jgi:hypothetical protein